MEHMSHVPYASVVGNIMYAMVCTRPDLAYVVSMVSHHIHNPGKNHYSALKIYILASKRYFWYFLSI